MGSNDLFVFDTVRHQSALDHYTRAISTRALEKLILLNFAFYFSGQLVSQGQKCSCGINTGVDMSESPRSKAFEGGKITNAFHFHVVQRLWDDLNGMLLYSSVTAFVSVLYFIGNLVAGNILSRHFSTCCWIHN